jgi:hypothetical protein
MTKVISMDGLDKALIGRSCIWDSSGRQEDRLVYSGEKIVAILIARDNMTPDEALEFIDNEIQGGFIVGEQNPIVMWSQFMDDLEREYDIYREENPERERKKRAKKTDNKNK